jgi:hypothetical protein
MIRSLLVGLVLTTIILMPVVGGEIEGDGLAWKEGRRESDRK